MSLADSLKPLARSIRGIPGTLGVRPHRVYIVATDYTGEHTGDGTRYEEAVEITEGNSQPPKVRWLNDEEIAIGNLGRGTVEVGPITTEGGGGLTLAELRSESLLRGGARHLRIVGPQHPNGADYRILDFKTDRALHYTIRAVPVEERE